LNQQVSQIALSASAAKRDLVRDISTFCCRSSSEASARLLPPAAAVVVAAAAVAAGAYRLALPIHIVAAAVVDQTYAPPAGH
jgi:hypothetical protein